MRTPRAALGRDVGTALQHLRGGVVLDAIPGAARVAGHALAQKITEIDRAECGDTTWVAFGGDELANLFRAIDVHALNGVHPLPQLELWRRIDPEGRYRSVYDRYAHVAFVASASGEPRFRLHSQDYVIVEIRPNSAEFRALGVTHVLVRDAAAAAFEKLSVEIPMPQALMRLPKPHLSTSRLLIQRREASDCHTRANATTRDAMGSAVP